MRRPARRVDPDAHRVSFPRVDPTSRPGALAPVDDAGARGPSGPVRFRAGRGTPRRPAGPGERHDEGETDEQQVPGRHRPHPGGVRGHHPHLRRDRVQRQGDDGQAQRPAGRLAGQRLDQLPGGDPRLGAHAAHGPRVAGQHQRRAAPGRRAVQRGGAGQHQHVHRAADGAPAGAPPGRDAAAVAGVRPGGGGLAGRLAGTAKGGSPAGEAALCRPTCVRAADPGIRSPCHPSRRHRERPGRSSPACRR